MVIIVNTSDHHNEITAEEPIVSSESTTALPLRSRSASTNCESPSILEQHESGEELSIQTAESEYQLEKHQRVTPPPSTSDTPFTSFIHPTDIMPFPKALTCLENRRNIRKRKRKTYGIKTETIVYRIFEEEKN